MRRRQGTVRCRTETRSLQRSVDRDRLRPDGVIRVLSETRAYLVFNRVQRQTQLFGPSPSLAPIRNIADPPVIALVGDLTGTHSVRVNPTGSD